MATARQSRTPALDRATEETERSTHWNDIGSPVIVSRIVGIGTLGLLLVAPFLLGATQFHADLSAQQAVAWVSQHQQLIWLDGFESGLVNTLYALVIVLLVALTTRTGILARVAYIGAAAGMATAWAKAGVEYGLADLAHRGGASAGVLALFSLAKTTDYTDGFALGLAVGCASLLLLRSRAVPRPVAWLGLLVAVGQMVVMPVQIAITGTGNGLQGPISVFSWLLWLLVVGLVLLVKPVRRSPSPDGTQG